MKSSQLESNTLKFDTEDLLYRNQFVLGPSYVCEFDSWTKIKVTESLFITAHPDLNIYQTTNKDKSITLLGYILDPDNPQDDDASIVEMLAHTFENNEDIIKRTYNFGGRWILVVYDGKETRLFHDAGGLRQVFYTDISQTQEMWCGSQPGIIAENSGFEMDQEAIDYIEEIKTQITEYWWPGDSSPYREIRHLLPNHYLNLETGRSHRYWPSNRLEEIPLQEAVEKASILLKGLIRSAVNRYDLVLSITAGWDSRLVLAASKDISDKISYVTVKKMGQPVDHPDIAIPSLLLARLGLAHNVLMAKDDVNDEFLRVCKKSISFFHDVWAPDIQVNLDYYQNRKVAVTGSMCELTRDAFMVREDIPRHTTGETLSKVAWIGSSTFIHRYFQKWLSALDEIYNYDVVELLYWEQRIGNWLAMCQLEFDMCFKDTFTPYNCRNLLTTMLSVKKEDRIEPNCKYFKELMSYMWPEVLSVPINPHKKKSILTIIRSNVSQYLPTKLKRYIKKFVYD